LITLLWEKGSFLGKWGEKVVALATANEDGGP